MGVFEQTLRWRRWKSRATGAWIAAVLALQFAALVVFWPARAAAPQPSVTAPFTDASFQALLAHDPMTGQPVDTVQALLPLLPRALRTNFTLVYDSRSPFKDQITPASPPLRTSRHHRASDRHSSDRPADWRAPDRRHTGQARRRPAERHHPGSTRPALAGPSSAPTSAGQAARRTSSFRTNGGSSGPIRCSRTGKVAGRPRSR